jgi:hypothetical protein
VSISVILRTTQSQDGVFCDSKQIPRSLRRNGLPVKLIDLLSAPLTIPLVCCHSKSFRRASSGGAAMARRRK